MHTMLTGNRRWTSDDILCNHPPWLVQP